LDYTKLNRHRRGANKPRCRRVPCDASPLLLIEAPVYNTRARGRNPARTAPPYRGTSFPGNTEIARHGRPQCWHRQRQARRNTALTRFLSQSSDFAQRLLRLSDQYHRSKQARRSHRFRRPEYPRCTTAITVARASGHLGLRTGGL